MSAKVPTALKVITGNPGKRALPKNEPRPEAPKSLKPLAWLSPEAKKEWRRVAPELERCGLLTEVDIGLLAAYCDAFADMQRAEKGRAKLDDDLATTPNGLVQQHALVGIKRGARSDMATFCKLFGMAPTARSGMDVHINRKPPAEVGGKDKPAKSKFFGD